MQTTWAVVPLKAPDTAKSRLSAVLTPPQRRDLFYSLARRVLLALQATPGIEQVAVVTASAEVLEFASAHGACAIRQMADAGTASAFEFAAVHLRTQPLQRLLMIAGDLPLITTAAVQKLIESARAEPEVIIVPDRLGIGTNAILCTPPEALAPCFGPKSFARHLAVARAQKLSVQVLRLDELAFDLDVETDLQYWQQIDRKTRSCNPCTGGDCPALFDSTALA